MMTSSLMFAAPGDSAASGPAGAPPAVRVSPYGTWTSPLDARTVASGALRLGGIVVDGDDVYWVEGRPAEGGRYVVVRRGPDGAIADATPPESNVRTRVQEYGGAAYIAAHGTLYYSNYSDQRLYRLRRGGVPEALTPAGQWFYADCAIDEARGRLVCVREDHGIPDREAATTLVSIPLAGPPSAGEVIASGYDFYSTPRLSPDGSRLAWLSWRHPHMPWDGSELWVASIRGDGTLEAASRVAGGPRESIFQPGWSPDGTLYFVSDRTGWWNLYRARSGAVEPAHQMRAEFGRPQWQLGMSTWAFAAPTRIVAAYTSGGVWRLSTIDTRTGALTEVGTDLQPEDAVAATATHAFFVAASPLRPAAIARVELATGRTEVVREAAVADIDPGYLSTAAAIEFPARLGPAHAFYYAPRNRDFAAPAAEKPPLIVMSHGGPTSATSAGLNLQVQYWTSRGFAVVDLNYSGSSGYGRSYRERLNGRWGIADVTDCVDVAKYLVAQGRADERRLIIRGGSAGGYTTLAALTFHAGVFKAGASYYGISDIEVLAHDTHKFESRYLDSLIGPYPASREIYRARSPIHFIDRLACPLILFQGLEDKVVPPNQSQMMADALRAKGLPVAYLTFEGEQHGFRKAETIVRSLEAELDFYGAVFGFTPAGNLPPIKIDNLNRQKLHR